MDFACNTFLSVTSMPSKQLILLLHVKNVKKTIFLIYKKQHVIQSFPIVLQGNNKEMFVLHVKVVINL